MIGEIFSLLDGVARVIGWASIFFGMVWFVGRALEDRRLREEAQIDQEAMFAFESYLAAENVDRFNRYEALKRRYAVEEEDVHWHQVALESGVPRVEIIKDRRETHA